MKIIATNRKARYEYFIERKFEAGIVLQGDEVKSIRLNGISIQEGYITDFKGELFLVNSHVSQYKHSYNRDYDPKRMRKLLLHKKQIYKIISMSNQKSYTCMALLVYLTRGLIKVTIGICKGKKMHDRRRVLKEKAMKRDERFQ
ncbi:MAG: SsrA-binding protein SmpB [Pseudomonadota bacterium]